ncbi:MAG TPA: helix-turn-helix transcriptional regulator [Mucilaginibacter sp.]|nr:helix-turn-helix transcriptional regulator [Mucilaginibacter sp.]
MQSAKSNLNITTGFLIRKFRVTKGWDQAVIAAKLDITRSSYSKIESGSTDVNLSRLEQIAFILDVKLIQLLSFDPEQEMRDASRYLSILAQIREKDRCIELLLHQIIELARQLKFSRSNNNDTLNDIP